MQLTICQVGTSSSARRVKSGMDPIVMKKVRMSSILIGSRMKMKISLRESPILKDNCRRLGMN